MAKHSFVLHLHDLGVVLLLSNHQFLLLKEISESLDLHLGFLQFQLFLPSQRILLIKLVLQLTLSVGTAITNRLDVLFESPHLDLVVIIYLALLLKLLLQ